MKLVGLTGGIACGKSTVSRLLSQHGIPIIDCDAIAHDVVRKASSVYPSKRFFHPLFMWAMCKQTRCAAISLQGTWGYRRLLAAFPGQQQDILLETGRCPPFIYYRRSIAFIKNMSY